MEKYITISLQNISNIVEQGYKGINVFLVVDGEIEIKVENSIYNLQSNDLILINNHTHYSIKSQDNNLVIRLQIQEEFLKNLDGDYSTRRYNCNTKNVEENSDNNFQPIRSALVQFVDLKLQSDVDNSLLIFGKTLELVDFIYKNFRVENTIQKIDKDVKSERFHRILRYINENFKENITLTDIAKKEFLSVYYLSRLFKEEVGFNFNEYLSGIRVEEAKNLLINTDWTINRIALESGFNSSQSFNKEFQKRYLESPGKFRKKIDSKTNSQPDVVKDIISEDDSNLTRFLNYRNTNFFDMELQKEVVSKLKIDLNKLNIITLDTGGKILNIGSFNNLNLQAARGQIKKLLKEISFEYIYFEDYFVPGSNTEGGNFLFIYKSLFNKIEFIHNINLKPIISVDVLEFIQDNPQEDVIILANTIIENFNTLSNYYGEEIGKWHLDFKNLNKIEQSLSINLLKTLIKQGVKNIGISLDDNCENLNEFFEFGEVLKLEGIRFEFVSFTNDPKKGEVKKNQLEHQIENLKSTLENLNLEDVKIFVTEFNTLAGESFEQAGVFFRASIILKIIVNSWKRGVSLSYLLNLDSASINKTAEKIEYNVLSLFLFDNIKRPVYFVLKFLEDLGSHILYRDDNFIIGKSNNTLNFLIYNEHYYDPVYSLKETYLLVEKENLSMEIEHLENGRYLVTESKLDKENGGQFDLFFSIIDNKYLSNEVFDHIERTNYPKSKIQVKNLEGRYTIYTELASNDILLYQLKLMK